MKNEVSFKDIFYIVILSLLVLIFFSRLFYPTPSVFVTPEFTRGDITHFYLPIKKSLSESLRNGNLPLWEKNIGTGFPLLAESQVSPFFVPNAILFLLLPYWTAFNVSFIVSFLIAAVGMYSYMRVRNHSREAAFLASFSFSFSGFFITQLSHLNIVQASAFLPWIMLIYEKYSRSNGIRYILIFSLVLSQQIFAGHIQITFIILVGLYYMVLSQNALSLKQRLRQASILAIGIILSLFLTLVQIVPTKELVDLSVRSGGLTPKGATFFSFSYRHLLTFIDPFILGKISDATYTEYRLDPGNLFWENSGYFGLIPLLLVLSAILYKRKSVIKQSVVGCGIALLLALGKYSPIYFLFSIPPLTFFRVPSRFLLLAVFFSTILVGHGFDILTKSLKKQTLRQFIITSTLILSVLHVFVLWYDYHPTISTRTWIEQPELVKFIKSREIQGRTYSSFVSRYWREQFITQGWKNNVDFYNFARNELSPNINLMWDIPHFQLYGGNVWIRRYVEYDTILSTALFGLTSKIESEHETAQKLLNVSSIQYIISDSKSNFSEPLRRVKVITDASGQYSYSLFENTSVLPRARMVYDFRIAKTLEELSDIFLSSDYNPREEVILEENIDIRESDIQIKPRFNVQTLTDENMKLRLSVSTNQNGILVLADSYYPGWKAYIDGRNATIYPANLNQRAILINKGNHQVTFSYEPSWLKPSIIISVLAHIIILSTMFLLLLSSSRTFFSTSRPLARL